MKKDLFNQIVDMTTTFIPVHKHTVKDGFHFFCFIEHDASHAMADLKTYMKGGLDVAAIQTAMGNRPTYSTYLTISYDETKDKISVARFTTGWQFAGRKNRFYPFKKQTPIACSSKNLYVFHFRDRKPRLMMTSSPMVWDKLIKNIMQMLIGIKTDTMISVPAKYAINAKDDWDIIHNYTNTRIPEALKIFQPEAVMQLIKTLRNPNELSTLCAYLSQNSEKIKAKFDKEEKETEMPWAARPTILDLYETLAHLMFGREGDSWLIRDYVNNLAKLKLKFSLTMRSKKRMEDEHRKTSKQIMIKGIKAIKVDDCYVNMFKDFPIAEAELITNKNRLLAESITQDHCVATYGHQINSGSCCIISIPCNGKQWTLQVSRVEVGKAQYDFRVTQFRGFRNSSAPEELERSITEHFSKMRTPMEQLTPAKADDMLPF